MRTGPKRTDTPLDLLRAYRDRLVTVVSPNDAMVLPAESLARPGMREAGWESQYFRVAEESLRAVVKAMLAAERTGFARILDFPCGHGRVARALRAAFPAAELTVSDIDRDGVDFCARTFAATGVYSDAEPERIALGGDYDLIYCGSLFSHFDQVPFRRFLRFLSTRLAPDGLIVFTTHGRWCVPFHHGTHPLIDAARFAAIERAFAATGFGYADYPETPGYGVALSSIAWVTAMMAEDESMTLVYAQERGLGNFQDVYAYQRARFDDPFAPIRAGRRAPPYRGAMDDKGPPAATRGEAPDPPPARPGLGARIRALFG